jgi:hypothetical protein
MAAGTLFVRQRTLAECLKRKRVIPETDRSSEEEEGGGVSIDDTRGSSSRAIHVAHCVHPDVLHPPRQLQVPATAAATSAAAAATAAATATTPYFVCFGCGCCLLPHLRCLPRMCCRLLLVLCLLLPTLLLLVQVGYNGLERRQSDRRNRNGGDSKRN